MSLGIGYRCDLCTRNVLMIDWCWNQRDAALFDCDERILRFVTVVATRYERVRRFSLQSLIHIGSGDEKKPERWSVNNSPAKCTYKSRSVISISWARAHANFSCLPSEHWLHWIWARLPSMCTRTGWHKPDENSVKFVRNYCRTVSRSNSSSSFCQARRYLTCHSWRTSWMIHLKHGKWGLRKAIGIIFNLDPVHCPHLKGRKPKRLPGLPESLKKKLIIPFQDSSNILIILYVLRQQETTWHLSSSQLI
jgi:hypothetical protein